MLRKLFSRTNKTHTTPFDSWEQAVSAGIRAPIQETRTYLENSPYPLPIDAEEDSRLDFQHHLLYHAVGAHHIAPISPPIYTIGDIGTGTGRWAYEIARRFPSSLVVGVDPSSRAFMRPEQVNSNCILREGNVLTGLPFPDAFLDYTHQRLLVAAITAENWPRVVHELVRVTRPPRGWVELIEMDDRMTNMGPAMAQIQEFIRMVSQRMGFDGEVIRHLGDLLLQEGLQEVTVQPIAIPVGEWGGRVGSMMKQDLRLVMDAIKERYCQYGGISLDEFDQMAKAAVSEWEVYQPCCTFYAAYGKRGDV